MGLPSELGAGEGAVRSAGEGHRAWWPAPLGVLPWIGLVAGAVALFGVSVQAVERFWWLALVAALVDLVLLVATIGVLTSRRYRERTAGGDLDTLEVTVRAALASSEADRQQTAESLLDRLPELSAVSRRLCASQRALLKLALREAGASAAAEKRLARSRTRWGRSATLQTLGWLGDERSIPALYKVLRGADPDLAFVAGQALAEYDSARACRCLLVALRDGRPSRAVVATLLESSRCRDSASLVAALAGNPDPDVRSWIAYLLGRSRTPAASGALRRLSGDRDSKVRASAAQALASFPDELLLRTLLTDTDWRVRANAARAIGDAGGPAALAAHLAPLLRDPVWWVRRNATISLKLLGQPQSS